MVNLCVLAPKLGTKQTAQFFDLLPQDSDKWTLELCELPGTGGREVERGEFKKLNTGNFEGGNRRSDAPDLMNIFDPPPNTPSPKKEPP